MDGIETEQNIVVLELIDKHGDGVELVVGVRCVSHEERLCGGESMVVVDAESRVGV